jgi:hypothetical protein
METTDPTASKIIDAALHAAKRVHVLAGDKARAHEHRDAEALEAAAKALVAVALFQHLDPDMISKHKGKAAYHAWLDALLDAESRDTIMRLQGDIR